MSNDWKLLMEYKISPSQLSSLVETLRIYRPTKSLLSADSEMTNISELIQFH